MADDVATALFAMKADQDSLRARVEEMERRDRERPGDHRDAMEMPHPSERSEDRKEEDHRREAEDHEREEEYTMPDHVRREARTKENPQRVPYGKDQTGMFKHPKESDGGSPLSKRGGSGTSMMAAAMGRMSFMDQRAFASDPSLTASERAQANAIIASMHDEEEARENMDPDARMKRAKAAAQAERLANMEQAGRTQLAQMGAPGIGVFGGARTASMEGRLQALESVIYNTPGTQARMAAVADYARSQGLNPAPYSALAESMSPAEIDSMNDTPALPGGEGARTASQKDGITPGYFELTDDMMEALS